MTVSTSTGRQFTINQIVRLGYQDAGLLTIEQTPTDAQFEFGRKKLEILLDALEGEGHVMARFTDFVEIDLVVGQSDYTMPANVLDLVNPAMYIGPTGETVVEMISEEEWQRYSVKDFDSRPYKFYPRRQGDLLVARLWPNPQETDKIRFRIQRKMADADDGNATFDLQNYWIDYVTTELARRLAMSQSLEQKASLLGRDAKEAKLIARRKSRPRATSYIHINHTGGRRARY